MSTNRTMVIPGGAGYLGRHLSAYFADKGWRVIVLTREPKQHGGGCRQIGWDGRTLGPWSRAIDGADAIVNLAGRSVNCRYTQRNRNEIYRSRLESTRVIGQAIAAARRPPAVWLNSSSATIYRDARDREMDELTGEFGEGFSVDVCQKWEAELEAAATPTTRKVAMRTAMVFGPGAGGVFEAFDRIVSLGLGGTLGDGGEFVSWVHLLDFCRAVEFLIDHSELAGAVNIASPHPIPNRDFMRTLRRARHQRIGLPAARWMLEIGAFFLRTETELLLKSRRVVPARLLAAGFEFKFPSLREAIEEIVSSEEIAGV